MLLRSTKELINESLKTMEIVIKNNTPRRHRVHKNKIYHQSKKIVSVIKSKHERNIKNAKLLKTTKIKSYVPVKTLNFIKKASKSGQKMTFFEVQKHEKEQKYKSKK